MTRITATTVLAAVAALSACDTTGPDPKADQRMGIIEWAGMEVPADSPVIDVIVDSASTSQVTAGEAFSVTVRTWAPSECWVPGDDEILTAQYTAIIVPYDRRLPEPETGCGFEVRQLSRTFLVVFRHAGTPARILVFGRGVLEGQDPEETDREVTLEEFVQVVAPE